MFHFQIFAVTYYLFKNHNALLFFFNFLSVFMQNLIFKILALELVNQQREKDFEVKFKASA